MHLRWGFDRANFMAASTLGNMEPGADRCVHAFVLICHFDRTERIRRIRSDVHDVTDALPEDLVPKKCVEAPLDRVKASVKVMRVRIKE